MLSVGHMFSTKVRNQLRAVQMSFLFLRPNLLLLGFMFPFGGMPQWPQRPGELLPLTHFLRIVRVILLKGRRLAELFPGMLALGAFMFVAMTIALRRYRQTLG